MRTLTRMMAGSLLLALLGCTPLAKAGNIFENPGFESGYSNWSFTDSGNLHGNDPGDPSHSGNLEAYLNAYPGYGTISQDLVTLPGHTYAFDWWMTANGSYATITVTFGSTIGYQHYFSPLGFPYQNYSFTATATSALTTFKVEGVGITGTFFFDDFNAQDVTTPEPTSGLLAACGILGIVFLRRKLAATV